MVRSNDQWVLFAGRRTGKVLALVCCLFAVVPVAGQDKPFDQAVAPFFKAHCVSCHGPTKQKGDFRIDRLSKDVGVKDTPLWAEVMERISSGEMPPDDVKNRPTAQQGARIVEWLSGKIKEGEAARMAKRSRVTFNRLSREEYVNTVYDLLGVYFDATDPGGLTEDPEWHGFERIGSVLSLSASHVEKYMLAAETVLDEAYPDKKPEPVVIHKRAAPTERVGEPHRSRLEAAGLLEKIRFDLWPGDKHRYSSPGRLPAAGVYECRIQLSGLKPANGRAPRIKVYHEQLDRVLFEQDVVAREDKPVVVSFRAHLPAGHQRIVVYNDVPGPSNLPRSGRHGRRPFVSIADGRIPWQMKLTDEDGNALYPFLILDWAEWEGPIVTEREQALRDNYVPGDADNMEQVRKGLERLATRAFRRPLRDGELDAYIDVVRKELAAGAEARAAVKAGMLAVLCSNSFLHLVEGSPDRDRNTLNDFELASRLSYMLWSTMPDDVLFGLAEQGKLSDKSVLRQQVARMLADPKAQRFSESFTWQWLHLRKVGMFPPDAKLYPQYDAHLENSMIGETTTFFREVLHNDMTLREFIDSRWTMLNPRLALHYGVEGVTGDQFRRVALKPEHHRGGLLTQAAVLSLTSDGTRHRPVHRGVWLSEAIFGKTPPPPPANVDPIEPNPVDAPKATIRMKLDAHKADPNCASCHRKIDPLGFAFDHYDAIGSWRTEEKVARGQGANPKVDASGVLPDGRAFKDAKEFKRLLLDDIDAFNATFVRKLATYGLRRAMTVDDRDDLAKVAAASKAADYRVRSIVEALVLSDLFRKR